MIVGDVQALLTAVQTFAETAGVSATAKSKMAAVNHGLEPFRSMDLVAFGELLIAADEFRRTGVNPIVTKKVKAATPLSEDVAAEVQQLIQQLKELYAIVHEDSVGYGAIDSMCEAIGKHKAPQVTEIATAFGVKGKSKGACVDQIKRKLTEQKGATQRTKPIIQN